MKPRGPHCKRTDHVIVLSALKRANVAFGRGACSSEVLSYIDSTDVRAMSRRYAKPPTEVVYGFLAHAARNGPIYHVGTVNHRAYFASRSVIPAIAATLPREAVTRQQRVLGVVRRLVHLLGRPVGAVDVMRLAYPIELEGVSANQVRYSIKRLVSIGQLKEIRTIRRLARVAYLPPEIDDRVLSSSYPLSRAEGVIKVFQVLWQERMRVAREEHGRPVPLTTREICKRYIETFGDGNANTIGQMLGALTARPHSPIRRIRRRRSRHLWVPTDVADDRLALSRAFASDAERLAEAVRRASIRLHRPVTASEVDAELRSDHVLKLIGTQSCKRALHSVAPEPISDTGAYRGRRLVHFHNIGRVSQLTYFCVDDPQAGISYVRFRELVRVWKRWKETAQPETINRCALPSIAMGRALQARETIARAEEELREIYHKKTLPDIVAMDASRLNRDISATRAMIEAALQDRRTSLLCFPTTVNTLTKGWSLEELWETLRQVHPTRVRCPSHIDSFGKQFIRRVTEFGKESRKRMRAKDVRYDCTDALLWAAEHWGGHECAIQASICRSELADLRDHRFVLPALSSTDSEARLAAIACCAFLWSDEGLVRLRELAVADPEAGVRDAAIWAYGFAGGRGAAELLRKASSDGIPSSSRFLEATNEDIATWWRM